MSLWAFGPYTPMFDWHLRDYFPFSCDGVNVEKRGLLAPDLMAGCLLYVYFWVTGYTKVMAAWFVMDFAYYGPMALAMPISAIWYWKLNPNRK